MDNTDEEWSDWSETVIQDVEKCELMTSYEDGDIESTNDASISCSDESEIDISKIRCLKTTDIFSLSENDSVSSITLACDSEECVIESDDEPLIKLIQNQDSAHHESGTNPGDWSFSDSDDEPLLNVKKRLRSRSPSPFLLDSDSSSSYCPSGEQSSSTDNEETWSTFVNKRREKHLITNQRKKKIFSRPRNTAQVRGLGKCSQKMCRDDKELQQNIEEAKLRSNIEMKLRTRLEKLHTQRLHNVLTANRLKQIPTSGDGNCFMTSVALQVESNAVALRKLLCDHIEERKDIYLPFLKNTAPEQNRSEETDTLDKLVQELRIEGCWLNEMADVLPLAVANVFDRPLKIFTSKIGMPIITINPRVESESIESIHLAYLATPGFEHYDAVESVGSSEYCPELGTPVKTSSSTRSEGPYTPRKAAMYRSPNLKNTTRKRKSDEQSWKKNIRKEKRNSGQQYIDSTGKKKAKRAVQHINCSKCRFKCTTNISEEQRLDLNANYWALGSFALQRQYICGSVSECQSKGKSEMKRKSVARQFSFNIDGKLIRVCKNFFLNTLDIGKRVIYSSLEKSVNGSFVSDDKRGKHTPHNKTNPADEDAVRRHIESFPVMEGHYTRKDTRRRYLHQELNITKMHELYQEECKRKNTKPVGSKVYRRIFCEEYNLSFFVPKKDQCNVCSVYNQRKETGSLDSECTENFQSHQERKVRARTEKTNDKRKAKETPNFSCACFDLQSVLSTPCSLVSQIYYKRKLNCYNFTIYEVNTKEASCYLWNESEGKRGANEIATCLSLHLKSLSPAIDHVCFYSDCCSGQNRNQFVAAALLHAVQTTRVKTIDHKFLESGHTHMECDSVHATIEHAKKKTSIFVPHQWDTIIAMSRKQKPYLTIPLKHWDICDFKNFAKHRFGQMQRDTLNNKVQWRQIRWFQFRKDEMNTIYFKTSFDDEAFGCIDVTKRQTRGRQCPLAKGPKHCYSSKIPISNAKKADLVSLCKSLVIPEEFHQFYRDLPSASSVQDCVSSGDSTDGENDALD